MEIKFIEKEDIMEEIILDDIEHVNESLIELKRSILNLNDKDEDSEVYHRFCDMEDEVVNVIEEIKSIVNNPHLISLRGFEEGACRKSARNFLLW